MKLETYIQKRKTHYSAVAADLGVKPETVRRHMKGERFPPPDVLAWYFKWSEGKVTPSDFLANRKAA